MRKTAFDWEKLRDINHYNRVYTIAALFLLVGFTGMITAGLDFKAYYALGFWTGTDNAIISMGLYFFITLAGVCMAHYGDGIRVRTYG